jgi:hypothetical protein
MWAIEALEGATSDEAIFLGKQMARHLFDGMNEDQIPIWVVWNYFNIENQITEQLMSNTVDEVTKEAAILEPPVISSMPKEVKKPLLGKMFRGVKSLFACVEAEPSRVCIEQAKTKLKMLGTTWDSISLYYNNARKELCQLLYESEKPPRLTGLYLENKPLPPL